MIVYAVTPKQMNKAFLDWIEETGTDDRKILHKIFNTFMGTAESRQFLTVTGLICFPFDKWELLFRRWAEHEIDRVPDHEDSIRRWTNDLIVLLTSSWCMKHKLIVRGCLDEMDLLND
jgi:hypothetical protein